MKNDNTKTWKTIILKVNYIRTNRRWKCPAAIVGGVTNNRKEPESSVDAEEKNDVDCSTWSLSWNKYKVSKKIKTDILSIHANQLQYIDTHTVRHTYC